MNHHNIPPARPSGTNAPPMTTVIRDDGQLDARVGFVSLNRLIEIEGHAREFLDKWDAAKVLGLCTQNGASVVELLAAIETLRASLPVVPG